MSEVTAEPTPTAAASGPSAPDSRRWRLNSRSPIMITFYALVLGLVFLFTQSSMFVEINWWLVVPLILVIIALIIFIIHRIRNTYRHKVTTGKEDLQGIF